MPPVYVDPAKVHSFASAQAFYDWLAKHHDTETEVWVRIFKKSTGTPTVNAVEGIETVLCWGWIDAIRKSYDDVSFVQRYTRRGPKSLWSQVNQDNVAKLIADGRMTEHGMRHVEAAKADGRWAAAYKMDMPPPPDLLAAIQASPKAAEFYPKLSAQNRFALTFRTHNLKTAAGRAKRIAAFVAMLENGETIYPQGKKS